MAKTLIHRAKGRTPRPHAHAVEVRIAPTLAVIRARIGRGTLALARPYSRLLFAGRPRRRGRIPASMLGSLLLDWPGALTADRKGRRGPEATRIVNFVVAQLEAAFRDDDAARKWWADLLPAMPAIRRDRTRRRKNVSKQGRANPIPDSEWIEAHRVLVTWCAEVRAAAHAMLGRLSVTLPSTRKMYTKEERARVVHERERVVRLLARHFAVADPALRDHHLLADVLNAPTRTAKRLTAAALAQRAAGYDGIGKLDEVLRAEKARRLAAQRFPRVIPTNAARGRPSMT